MTALRGVCLLLLASSGSLALAAPPNRGGPDFSRIEAPTPWDYRVDAPSRSACAPQEGRVYEVGPGQRYTTPLQVPWLQLMPCDEVAIHYRPEPYTDVIFIGARGAKDRFITIRGVPGPNGERPVFDGRNAMTPPAAGFNEHYDGHGMIVVGRPVADTEVRYGYKPGYLHISGLHIRNVRPPARYTALDGSVKAWADFSAAVYVNPAENLVITDCELADSGLGLFVNSIADEAQQSRRLLVARNYFHGNGGAATLHNAYTETVGIIYEANYFGPPAPGSLGDNIKDRSAGVVIRYNTIEGGTYSVSLRDPQSNGAFEASQRDSLGEPLVGNAFVYANLFLLRGQEENTGTMIGHGDGSFGDGRHYRYGNLFFYANTVVAQYDYQRYKRDAVTLFQLLNERAPTTVHALNNVFYGAPSTPGKQAAPFALFTWQGKADFVGNLISRFVPTFPNAKAGEGVFAGTPFLGSGIATLRESADTPGFVNPAAGDWRPGPKWPQEALNAPLPPAVTARSLQPMAQPVRVPFGPALPLR